MAGKKRKGFPKRLPCLGPCGRSRKSTGPGDRICKVCKKYRIPSVENIEQIYPRTRSVRED